MPTWIWLPVALIGLGLMLAAVRTVRAAPSREEDLEPLPWPDDLRRRVEAMARPIDPAPRRLVPPDEKAATIAAVATTPEALATLVADKPPAWPWAVFASVLVQRRNAVGIRLRAVASGYQPRPGSEPITGRQYSLIVYAAMNNTLDWVAQLEQFMRSPGFQGAFGDPAENVAADPDAVVAAAHRLMDFHERFLEQAERLLQTPVKREVLVFVHDAGQFALSPLASWEAFIATMCTRVGEAQELLPYTDSDTVIALDDATLALDLPDACAERITEHVTRFTGQG